MTGTSRTDLIYRKEHNMDIPRPEAAREHKFLLLMLIVDILEKNTDSAHPITQKKLLEIIETQCGFPEKAFRLSVALIVDRRHPQCDLTALIRYNLLDSLFEYLKQTA